MNIASSLNEYYLPYTYTMLLSLFCNNPGEHFRVFLLIDSLSDGARESLQNLASDYGSEAVFLQPDTERIRSALSGKTSWGIETAFRLTLSDLLPPDVDRILYIDGDVIILNKTRELYNLDFDGTDLIAGQDLFSCEDRKPDALSIHDKAFEKIIMENSYFNAGIVLYNMKTLREKNISSAYFSAIERLDCLLPYPDQDILNYVHYGYVKYFDTMKYNFQGMLAVSYDGGYNADRIRREVSIIHYIDKKPWNGGDHIHYDAENIWWDYALMTPYADSLMKNYIRSSMDEYVHNNVLKLKRDNDNLQRELKTISSKVKALMNAFNKL